MATCLDELVLFADRDTVNMILKLNEII